MNQIDNNNNKNEAKNIDFWYSVRRAVKKSIIPLVSLALINALFQIFFDYEMNRLALYGIIFVVSLIVSTKEWTRSRADRG